MARPNTRSGMMGPGPVPATLRPGSGAVCSHLPATLRPGSGMGPPGMGPPGTAARLGTRQGLGTVRGPGSRQGTAAQQPVIGVGAMTEVKVADRPMTTQGLGMKTGSIGPKRQVYDKTYYIGELRKRCTSLQEEVTKINNEINDIAQDSELYQSLEKRYDQLVKTVRSLEGDLADHNLATDKMRTDTQPEEVHHMYLIMKQQNEQQKSDVDQIFLEKRSHEEEIQRMVQEERDITRKAEERLNELHPDQRREYEGLREENTQLGKELTDGREELEQVSSRLNALEGHLRSDVMRARSQQLQVVHKEAMERLQVLEQEVRQCSMPVPEQREILLNKVKTDNAEIVAAEKRNSELKLEKERLKAQIKEVMTDAQERKDEGGDQQKYEILFAKDQEMSQFISSFDDHKAEEEAKMKEKQENIVRLLENISIALGLHNMTPEGHLAEMEDELKFKVGQLQNSETTQNRLEAELNKRQGELEKIESLDLKITQELQQVNAKMEQYENDIKNKYDRVAEMQGEGSQKIEQAEAELNKRQGELEKIESLDLKITQELQQVNAKMEQYENDIKNKYDRVAEMQGEGSQKIKELGERKLFLEGRLSTLKQQVGFLRLRHESRRQQLADDETASAIDAQEQKIRQFGQTLFTLQSFIKQKSSESDFQYEMASCLHAANELNKILQER
eukprot:CAMPEP_0169173720 /NCGR_PEP_ID=MMETSP1015-20121227/64077_1 /TAXON_ID=342587 /ORGANISM="Karlodinium micrum, Strain CCMP2283" /LENGTH=676 /DNA_ID=CAMNT_0009247359 /DNA_START=26 /DNA_END=2054 /DNA_ORIENTATION=+